MLLSSCFSSSPRRASGGAFFCASSRGSGGLSGTQVGSVTASRAIASGFYLFPDGSVTFAGASFDAAELTWMAQNLFVDKVSVRAGAPVPEASSGAGLGLLLVLGVSGMAWKTRKQTARA